MNTATFILKNALRNKRRATLSILSVAVSLFLLVTLQVALRELTVPPEDIGAALRVVVRSRISIANSLPARQRPIIDDRIEIDAEAGVAQLGQQDKRAWLGRRLRDHPLDGRVIGGLVLPGDVVLDRRDQHDNLGKERVSSGAAKYKGGRRDSNPRPSGPQPDALAN